MVRRGLTCLHAQPYAVSNLLPLSFGRSNQEPRCSELDIPSLLFKVLFADRERLFPFLPVLFELNFDVALLFSQGKHLLVIYIFELFVIIFPSNFERCIFANACVQKFLRTSENSNVSPKDVRHPLEDLTLSFTSASLRLSGSYQVSSFARYLLSVSSRYSSICCV